MLSRASRLHLRVLPYYTLTSSGVIHQRTTTRRSSTGKAACTTRTHSDSKSLDQRMTSVTTLLLAGWTLPMPVSTVVKRSTDDIQEKLAPNLSLRVRQASSLFCHFSDEVGVASWLRTVCFIVSRQGYQSKVAHDRCRSIAHEWRTTVYLFIYI